MALASNPSWQLHLDMRAHILVWLQGFQVAILLFHDWIPLGALNDIRAMRLGRRLGTVALATALSSLFPFLGLTLSCINLNRSWPHWLDLYLLAAYGFLFMGELEAWWIPYLLSYQPKRAADYQAMYGHTWAFLPPRNGIQINALHLLLHSATFATVMILVVSLIGRR